MSGHIGIDLGGTKIEILVLDDDGNELNRWREATPQHDYEGTIETISRMISKAEAELGSKASIGIGHPGSISPGTGLMKNANSTWLNGRSFDQDVMDAIGRKIAFSNDANCLGLSEATDGSGAGKSVVFSVIIGTGCGGALTVDRKVISGANGIGGEWGHNPLPRPKEDELPGPACYCGLYGCLETWISGTGLVNDHERSTGQHLSGAQIVKAAAVGDAASAASLERYIDRLARGLSTVINMIDPDVIVLGGGASNIGTIYERLPDLLQYYCFSDTVVTPVLKAKHGDSSGVRGAAWLGRDLEES